LSSTPPYPFSADSSPRLLLLLLRSEEHTSELQSQSNLVCRLLLEKKKGGAEHRDVGADHSRAPHTLRIALAREVHAGHVERGCAAEHAAAARDISIVRRRAGHGHR